MLLSAEENEMEEGMKKLTDEQKAMFGYSVIASMALTGLIIPICMADRDKEPLWLLLWPLFAMAVGVALVALQWWIDGDEK